MDLWRLVGYCVFLFLGCLFVNSDDNVFFLGSCVYEEVSRSLRFGGFWGLWVLYRGYMCIWGIKVFW